MDHNLTGSSRVLAIPELVDIIASYSEPADVARLARVSRQPFHILLPSIWKEVHGAHNLLRLIKSAKFQYEESSGKLCSIKLKKKKGRNVAEEFRRFDLYAPFITTLRIYNPAFARVTVTGWEFLTSRAKQGPLLPNLKELAFDNGVRLFRAKYEMQWITAFSHQDLCVMRLARNSEFTSSDTSVVLDLLVQRSPKIQELSFYPKGSSSPRYQSDDDDDDDDASSDSPTHSLDSDAESDDAPWGYLSQLTQLRCLSVTDEWLGRSFLKTLSQLPNLQTLKFRGQGLPELLEPEEMDPYLPTRPFPMLSQLALRKINPRDAIRVVGSRKMLKNVSKFRLDYAFDMEFEEREEWIVEEFLPMLVNLPCLTELEIKETIPSHDLGIEAVYMIGRRRVLEAMAKLPLKTVYLGHMYLGTGALGLDLASIWPNVTELLIPSQLSSVVELSYFAAIPNLTRLVLRLDFSRADAPVATSLSNHAPLKTLESGHYAQYPRSYEVMHHNARILRKFWPGLKRVTWSERDAQSVSLAKSFNKVFQFSLCQLWADEMEDVDPNDPLAARVRGMEQEFVSVVRDRLRGLIDGESSDESSTSGSDD